MHRKTLIEINCLTTLILNRPGAEGAKGHPNGDLTCYTSMEASFHVDSENQS